MCEVNIILLHQTNITRKYVILKDNNEHVISAPDNAIGGKTQTFLTTRAVSQVDGSRARAHEGRNKAVRAQVEPHAAEGIS